MEKKIRSSYLVLNNLSADLEEALIKNEAKLIRHNWQTLLIGLWKSFLLFNSLQQAESCNSWEHCIIFIQYHSVSNLAPFSFKNHVVWVVWCILFYLRKSSLQNKSCLKIYFRDVIFENLPKIHNFQMV